MEREVNRNLLMARIKMKGYSVGEFLSEVKISKSSWSKKTRGIRDFTRMEMLRISDVLDLSLEDAADIFFYKKVS